LGENLKEYDRQLVSNQGNILGYLLSNEYMDGDTLFADFERGRIASKNGKIEVLKPNEQPSWQQQPPLLQNSSDTDYEKLVKAVYDYNAKGGKHSNAEKVITDLGYKVDPQGVFDEDNGKGFFALGLHSTTKPPVLVIRGTGDMKDLFSDTDPQSIGQDQFDKFKVKIETWLQDAQVKEKRLPDVTGHSLGGAISQLVAANFPTKVNRVVTFNSPGISRLNAGNFSKGGGNKNNVVHYIVSGDLVSMAGEAYIAGRVSMISYLDFPDIPKTIDPSSEHLITIGDDGKGVISNTSLLGFNKNEDRSLESWLSNPLFHYNDIDYLAFIIVASNISPSLAYQMLFRVTTEASRVTIGKFIRNPLPAPPLTYALSIIGQLSQYLIEKIFELMQKFGESSIVTFSKTLEFGRSNIESAVNLTLDLGEDVLSMIDKVVEFGKDTLERVFDLIQKAGNKAREALNAINAAVKYGKDALESLLKAWK